MADETKETAEQSCEDSEEVATLSDPTAVEHDEDASEAQAQIIESLRSQVTDLFTQVTQLNSKLVASYDRVSDLEDQFHESSSSLRNATLTISSLELERSEHLAALNTGLLVEKAHVTAELNRLMERATEEAAQRGQAESARHDIEKDLDDLSATLFHQANTMVAEARLNQARSERKVREAEEALKSAEEAVKVMQAQMQALEADKMAAEREASDARTIMGKGKWVERHDHKPEAPKMRFLTIHTPYTEFMAFVAHLRTLRSSQFVPPAISSLLNQPFLTRLITEDSEPTVRLDLAPSLNWLSRRSVLAAIHSGMLTVEPMSFSNLLQELSSQLQSCTSVSCALCGTHIARLSAPSTHEKSSSYPLVALTRTNSANTNSWFKYPLTLSSPSHMNQPVASSFERGHPEHVYVFRLAVSTVSQPPPPLAPAHSKLASTSTSPTSSRVPPQPTTTSRVLPTQTHNSPYPLCSSNYCLLRLRATCSLWTFVRTGIVERIWEEEVDPPKSVITYNVLRSGYGTPKQSSTPTGSRPTSPNMAEKPPVPPRRRRLWEMASALSERAVNWGKDGGDGPKDKEKVPGKRLPSPPPSHPSAPHPHSETPPTQARVPPSLPKRSGKRSATPGGVSADEGVEAPLSETVPTEEPVATGDAPLDLELKDKSASSESFATPTDEIHGTLPASGPGDSEPPPDPPRASTPATAQTEHSLSPHNIPLPQTPPPPSPQPRSRVGSPVSQAAASPMALSRSRTGSPVPGRAGSPFPPSRTGSPSPHGAPPVPRRAAARRAAPLPPSTPGVTERPPTPVTRLKKEGSPGSRGSKQEGSAIRKDVIQVAPACMGNSSDGVAPPAPPVSGDSLSDDTNIFGTVEAVAVPSEQSASNPPEPAIGGQATQVSSTEPEPILESHAENTAESSAEVKTPVDTSSPKQVSSADGEGFASDATWEERTWKEVVRLREEMFWTRVGCVREL
ncbi:proline-rich protein [Scleroderma citrinum]